MTNIPLKLKEKFFTDPDWSHVENTIAEYINPLRDVLTIDATQDAETVRAEVLSRQLSYEKLDKFLQDAGIITKPLSENINTFR
jgi:spermidine synthase